MNNLFSTLTIQKIQVLKKQNEDLKKIINQVEKHLSDLKAKKVEIENDLKYQQNIVTSFKTCRFANIKFI